MGIQDFLNWAKNHHVIEAYKFGYYPSFSRAFEAVLWQDQEGKLYGSLQLGASYYHSLSSVELLPAKQMQEALEPAGWKQLQEILGRYAFWSEHSWDTRAGLDGALWYFTGLKHGISKFRKSWCPEKDEPAYELGWFFFNLVPFNFCSVLTYEQAQERVIPLPEGFPVILVS